MYSTGKRPWALAWELFIDSEEPYGPMIEDRDQGLWPGYCTAKQSSMGGGNQRSEVLALQCWTSGELWRTRRIGRDGGVERLRNEGQARGRKL